MRLGGFLQGCRLRGTGSPNANGSNGGATFGIVALIAALAACSSSADTDSGGADVNSTVVPQDASIEAGPGGDASLAPDSRLTSDAGVSFRDSPQRSDGGTGKGIDAAESEAEPTHVDAASPSVDGGDASSPYLAVCETSLCLGGQVFRVKGATAYGEYDDPSTEIAAALAANVNTLEMVEFETEYHTLSDTMSEATWTRVDKFVAAVSSAGLHVIFNLSSYGQSLEAAGQTATTVDWMPYLKFITTRVNTVSHVTYREDPTIAMFELFGEIPQPTGTGTNGTPQEMTDFYHRTLGELATLDPSHLRSTGGFSYLDAANASGTG